MNTSEFKGKVKIVKKNARKIMFATASLGVLTAAYAVAYTGAKAGARAGIDLDRLDIQLFYKNDEGTQVLHEI